MPETGKLIEHDFKKMNKSGDSAPFGVVPKGCISFK
jgi:hypothetical protein